MNATTNSLSQAQIDRTVDADDDVSKPNLAPVWEALDSPVYRIVDEDGVNVADAQCRRLDRHNYWLIVDEQDGYAILEQSDVDSLLLVPEAVHVPLGWDSQGRVIEL